MSDATMMTPTEIEALAQDTLVRCGAKPENAASLARAIAGAERDDITSHGLLYLPIYVEHLRCGKVDGQAEAKVEKIRPSALAADAATGFAHAAIDLGFAQLIPLAREQGIACLTVRNSYNCGVLGYHTERLASAGLLGLGFTNAPASIAPVGGKTPVIGTNPISLAVPDGVGGAAILIDQSASVIAKSEVMKHAREERPIPEGWALDPDGQPTRDADLALKGSMAPSGGYKGVGVGLITEVLAAALSGATLGIHASPFSGTEGGPPKTGQCFIAIDATAAAGDVFAERVTTLVEAIADQPGARIPGQGRRAARKHLDRNGIQVPAALLERIRAL